MKETGIEIKRDIGREIKKLNVSEITIETETGKEEKTGIEVDTAEVAGTIAKEREDTGAGAGSEIAIVSTAEREIAIEAETRRRKKSS